MGWWNTKVTNGNLREVLRAGVERKQARKRAFTDKTTSRLQGNRLKKRKCQGPTATAWIRGESTKEGGTNRGGKNMKNDKASKNIACDYKETMSKSLTKTRPQKRGTKTKVCVCKREVVSDNSGAEQQGNRSDT